jgi:hypothetical protein
MLAIGALATTPATAAKFLTKKRADKLFLGNTTVVTNTQTVPSGDGARLTMLCPSGQQATDGGADSPGLWTMNASPDDGMLLLETKPVISAGRSVGWETEVFNVGSAGNPLQITGYAVCAA